MCGVLCAEEADVSQCAASAVSGFKSWSLLSCYQRAKVLLRSVQRRSTELLRVDRSSHDLPVLCCQAGGRPGAARSVLVGAGPALCDGVLASVPDQAPAVLQQLGSAPGHAPLRLDASW